MCCQIPRVIQLSQVARLGSAGSQSCLPSNVAFPPRTCRFETGHGLVCHVPARKQPTRRTSSSALPPARLVPAPAGRAPLPPPGLCSSSWAEICQLSCPCGKLTIPTNLLGCGERMAAVHPMGLNDSGPRCSVWLTQNRTYCIAESGLH